jgi:hypothetical protein
MERLGLMFVGTSRKDAWKGIVLVLLLRSIMLCLV